MNLTSSEIGKLGEIATLYEVAAYPKPGNVHRTHDFENMSFEDFLVSSVVIKDNLQHVAEKTFKCYPNLLNEVNLGENILNCVKDTNNLVNTNTNLGISMLLIPIASAVATLVNHDSINSLADNLDILIKNTQVNDAIALTNSIKISHAGGMQNKPSKYDINDSDTIDEIIENKITMYDLLKISEKYDKISYDLVNKLPVITKIGYPEYINVINDFSRNDATIQTYLTILANVPDTLISRKYGEEISNNISKMAKEILDNTDIGTKNRLDALNKFDSYLHNKKYNPGTTADFTAASLFVGLLDKYFNTGI
ncbi:MAG: ATP--dephospho-CoA triphosphoribosyl transferase CitG [Methanosphaera stadtmanae]|nr:ATP--dephospho-CoA triphosphoribosyl transferase CitG [Methanosphaera stadtmanae]